MASRMPLISLRSLRQANDLGAMPIGRDVVVIGGGMTAVDAAVQAKLLGRFERDAGLSQITRADERECV